MIRCVLRRAGYTWCWCRMTTQGIQFMISQALWHLCQMSQKVRIFGLRPFLFHFHFYQSVRLDYEARIFQYSLIWIDSQPFTVKGQLTIVDSWRGSMIDMERINQQSTFWLSILSMSNVVPFPQDGHKNCSSKIITLSGTVPNVKFFNIQMTKVERNSTLSCLRRITFSDFFSNHVTRTSDRTCLSN